MKAYAGCDCGICEQRRAGTYVESPTVRLDQSSIRMRETPEQTGPRCRECDVAIMQPGLCLQCSIIEDARMEEAREELWRDDYMRRGEIT